MKFTAGQVVTDTSPASVAADLYWPGLTSATIAPGMVALDGSASTMKSASAFANEVIRTWITGVESVGG